MKLNIKEGHWPPGGWQYFDPKTGYRETKPTEHDRREAAQAIMSMRKNNPHIYKGPALTYDAALEALELFTARRLNNQGLSQYLVIAPTPVANVKKKPFPVVAKAGAEPAERSSSWIDKIRKIVNGAATLADWVGHGQKPVPHMLAANRASVCLKCPLNQEGSKITGVLAAAIKHQTEFKTHLSLTTPHDAQLKSCSACDCHLPLKVWVPVKTILHHTSAEVRSALDKNCWILAESPSYIPPSFAVTASKKQRADITIRRRGAIGDVIMASAVAKKIAEVVSRVTVQTVGGVSELISNLPYIHSVVTENSGIPHAEVNLDHAYEKLSDLERSRNPIPEMMVKSAVQSLALCGITLNNPYANIAPEILLTSTELAVGFEQLRHLSKPWIAVVPRSNSWPCRTVSPESWQQFAGYFKGMCSPVWTGTDPAPEGFVDRKLRSLRGLAAMFKHCDMVVSVDTGPLHIASAVGTPIVHVTQSVAGIMTLPDQRDWIDYRMPLDCLACHHWKCPIDEKHPPCQDVPGGSLAAYTDSRLNLRHGEDVSVVLVTYQPDVSRINKAIDHVLPQVKEIIVALDGDTSASGITRHDKIRFVQHYSRKRRGFGKTFNLGARHSSCRYILSLNDDVFVNGNCVEALKSALQSKPNAAVVGALLRYPNGKIQHGGTRRGGDGFGHIDHNQLNPSITRLTEMECITFALAMFRRKAFYDVLGFDERYDCYSEDPDFCLRVRRRGWSVMYEPASQAIHIEAQTTKNLNRSQLLHDGHKIFKELWGWYFTLNKNNSGLGTFA